MGPQCRQPCTPGLGCTLRWGLPCWLCEELAWGFCHTGWPRKERALPRRGPGGDRSRMGPSGHEGKLEHRSRGSEWLALSPEG